MKLSDLKANSYVPYSGKEAVCVVESERSHFFPGVRIENSVFPLTISEQQCALFSCISEGERPVLLYAEDPDNDHLYFWKKEFGVSIRSLNELEDFKAWPVVLPPDNIDITEKLEKLLVKAVTRNSDFPVSSILKTDHGIITGVNVECTEWSLGLCAERIALAKAISHGIRRIDAIYVHTLHGEFSSPCGACRQVIIEHMPSQPVYLYHANHTRSMHYSMDLLPYSFRSSSLKKH